MSPKTAAILTRTKRKGVDFQPPIAPRVTLPGDDVGQVRYFPIHRPTFFDLSCPGNVASIGGRTKLGRILSAKRWLERSPCNERGKEKEWTLINSMELPVPL
ncbi:hypothetical protein TBK1r_38670 [Stieleria magnilauensis]|uniref:Uncharacterized protein n=1 Tax=Stieleria magnilauensis TaxID=2527963 RepID=A0ABX5XSD1_9BACT|nr:hypothetical protein TBK1r_38670 [Planctomycetes bacterium TBK1r]